MVDVPQARNGRDGRASTGGDDLLVRTHSDAIDVDVPGGAHRGVAMTHLDTVATQRGVVLRGGDPLDRRVHRPHAIGDGFTPGRGGEERLRRDAAGERAVTAEAALLHQQGLRATAGGFASRAKASGPAADDGEVVVTHASPCRVPVGSTCLSGCRPYSCRRSATVFAHGRS